MNNFEISIINEQNIINIDEQKVLLSCKQMLFFLVNQKEICSKSALSRIEETEKFSIVFDVLICDNKKIAELNKLYKNKDKATDVLSFALFADSKHKNIIINNEIMLGEIIISAQTALSQSKENKKEFMEEVYFLLSHGILHLFGFKHNDEDSLAEMLRIQEKMILELSKEYFDVKSINNDK